MEPFIQGPERIIWLQTAVNVKNNHNFHDINGEMVERVQHFRYLGITLDDHLSFNQHILGMYKACQQRLTVLRKPKQLSVQPHLLYRSIIEAVLMYGAICFFSYAYSC